MHSPLVLEVDGLHVKFAGDNPVHIVREVSFDVRKGETHGIIGESGSGKSVTAFAVAQLLPFNAIVSGNIRFQGRAVGDMSAQEIDALRGKGWAVIFQDPSGSFNPVKTIRWHLKEVLKRAGRESDDGRLKQLLADVGIKSADRVLTSYPFQLSGGMLQRVLIAMVQAVQPQLIIADEPTTNLDKLIENQILDLLAQARGKLGAGVILITHDLMVARRNCDRISVMYAGEIVETGPARELLDAPAHPYTRALLASALSLTQGAERLQEIPGEIVPPTMGRVGCAFANRCEHAQQHCREHAPSRTPVSAEHTVRCWLYAEEQSGHAVIPIIRKKLTAGGAAT